MSMAPHVPLILKLIASGEIDTFTATLEGTEQASSVPLFFAYWGIPGTTYGMYGSPPTQTWKRSTSSLGGLMMKRNFDVLADLGVNESLMTGVRNAMQPENVQEVPT